MSALRNPVMKEVPKEWESRLAEFSPQTNRFTWLKIIWEQGYEWEPVERWLLYSMVPRHGIPEGFLEQLEHPLPPSQMGNYYDKIKGEFVRNPDCVITERAYWLYRETKCWGRPFWVIQGDEGGHKRWFSPVEKKFLKLAGLPPEPPAPGDLPYAEFDDRVMKRLQEWDLMKGIHSGLRRKKSLLHGLYSSRVEADERAFREQLVKWLAEQVTALDGEKITKALMRLDAPRSKDDPKEMERMQETAEQNFIETGNTYGGMKLLT